MRAAPPALALLRGGARAAAGDRGLGRLWVAWKGVGHVRKGELGGMLLGAATIGAAFVTVAQAVPALAAGGAVAVAGAAVAGAQGRGGGTGGKLTRVKSWTGRRLRDVFFERETRVVEKVASGIEAGNGVPRIGNGGKGGRMRHSGEMGIEMKHSGEIGKVGAGDGHMAIDTNSYVIAAAVPRVMELPVVGKVLAWLDGQALATEGRLRTAARRVGLGGRGEWRLLRSFDGCHGE